MSTNTETEFVDGLIAKAPREGAPDFIKACLSIKREELIAWLQSREGEWVNVDIKESKGGKFYAAVDPWKPNQQRGGGSDRPKREQKPRDDFDSDQIPF